MQTTEQTVRETIRLHLGFTEEKVINDTDKLVDDLGADDLDFLELIMAFEDEFGIEIPDDECNWDTEPSVTVGQFIAIVKKARGETDVQSK